MMIKHTRPVLHWDIKQSSDGVLLQTLKRFFLLFLALITLNACFRENNDYPVGVDPFSITESDIPGYYIGTEISETMNYYVPSQNSDAYLLLEQETITDSLLHRGDFLWFGEIESFTLRDSIYISAEYDQATPTFFLGVYRDSLLVNFSATFPTNSIRAFIPAEKDNSNIKLVTWGDEFLTDYAYNNQSGSSNLFTINLTPGQEFAFYSLNGSSSNYTISYSNSNMHILTKDFYGFMPSGLGMTGNVSINSSIDSNTLAAINGVYNNLLVSNTSISVNFNTVLNDNDYIVICYKQLPEHTPENMLLYEHDTFSQFDNSSNYWSIDSDNLQIFPNKTGDYILVENIPDVNEYKITLDGSFSTLCLGDFYCNLKTASLNNTYLTINLQASIDQWDTYYGSNSYGLMVPDNIYGFTFTDFDGTSVTLTDDEYIEVGFPSAKANRMLFYHKDDGQSLTIGYLTEDISYDERHYTEIDGYLYFGVNSSCNYFFSDYEPSITNKSIPLPYNKVYYNFGSFTLNIDTYSNPISSINISFNTPIPYVDTIFSGYPYKLNTTPFSFNVDFFSDEQEIQQLDDDEYIEIGIHNDYLPPSYSHLFTIDNSASEFRASYKTMGDEYDEEHFSIQNDYTYFGLASSSDYLFSEANTDLDTYFFELPTKAILLEADDFFISSESVTSANKLVVNTQVNTDFIHNYFDSNPFSIETPEFIYEFSFLLDNNPVSELREGESVVITKPASVPNGQSVVIDYAESASAVSIISNSEYTVDSRYTYENDNISMLVYRTGKKCYTSLNPLSSDFTIPLLKQHTEIISLDLSIVTDLTPSLLNSYPDGLIVNASIQSDLPEEAIDIFNQYDNLVVSSVYHFGLSDTNNTELNSLLETINPAIEINIESTPSFLCYFSPENRNRLYTYPLGEVIDGYNFTVSNNKALFLIHDPGYYVAIRENTPMLMNDYNITDVSSPINVSFYQTQFMLPAYFVPFYFEVGDRVVLRTESVIPGYNPITSVRLDFIDNSNQAINTAFIYEHAYEESPILYLSFPPSYTNSNLRLFFRDINGNVTEYTRVNEFSEDMFYLEFIAHSNCAIVVVNSPGSFFITN